MKKTFLVMATLLLSYMGVNAQQSEVELANQETKTEQFLKECSFVREDQITSYVGKGLEVYGKIFTDLKSGAQIAAIEFYTQKQVAAGMALNAASALSGGSGNVVSNEEMAAKPLGYLDMDNVDDLIMALEQILAMANNASKKDAYSISYTAPGGIDVYFSQGIKDPWGVKGDASVFFRKKWYGTNEYGTRTAQYTETKSIKVENLAKIIPVVKETKMIAERELKKSYAQTPKVTKPAVVPVAEKTIETVTIETAPTASDIVTEPVAETTVSETSPSANIEDYKTQLNTTLLQIVQKYNALGLTQSAICKSYMQCGRLLIKSNNIDDLQVLDKLNTLVESLLDKYCMIDKKAMEKQLASQKTPEGMLEVFKSVMK